MSSGFAQVPARSRDCGSCRSRLGSYVALGQERLLLVYSKRGSRQMWVNLFADTEFASDLSTLHRATHLAPVTRGLSPEF